jgi:hypothetical protein
VSIGCNPWKSQKREDGQTEERNAVERTGV